MNPANPYYSPVGGFGAIQRNPYLAAQSGLSPIGFGVNLSGVQNFFSNANRSVRDFMNQTNNPAWLQGAANWMRNPENPLFGVGQFGASLINIGEHALDTNTNSYVSPFVDKNVQAVQGAPVPKVNGVSAIPFSQAMQAGAQDGMTPQQVTQQMLDAGFVQKYIEGVGMSWVRTGTAAGTPAMGGGYNGRPEWVDGASLQPGEEVTDVNGNRYVGGTPAPDGTPQYAVNYANPNARDDKHGKYKWVSDVRRDRDGNWVRVNRQVLRKVYTRSHLKKAAGRREQQPTAAGGTEQNQLVNFRVNYG